MSVYVRRHGDDTTCGSVYDDALGFLGMVKLQNPSQFHAFACHRACQYGCTCKSVPCSRGKHEPSAPSFEGAMRFILAFHKLNTGNWTCDTPLTKDGQWKPGQWKPQRKAETPAPARTDFRRAAPAPRPAPVAVVAEPEQPRSIEEHVADAMKEAQGAQGD